MLVCRGDRVREVDVLCYRDYTREGRRVTTHSLLLRAVKLPPKTSAQGEKTICTCTYSIHKVLRFEGDLRDSFNPYLEFLEGIIIRVDPY